MNANKKILKINEMSSPEDSASSFEEVSAVQR
jgi:hypothetical protein